MDAPAGWYPTDEGVSRYWDGNRWTEHTHPGLPPGAPAAAATSSPATQAGSSTMMARRSLPAAGWFGWGGLLLLAAVGAAASGLSGAGILCGLFVAAVGLVALARGRVGWAHLRTRAAGGGAIGLAVVLFAVGGATAEPQPAAVPQAGPTTPQTAATATTTSSPTTAIPTTAPPAAPRTTPPTQPAATGTALAAAAALPVKGRAAKTGYARGLFGPAWFDTDRNGCDTRNDILRRDLVARIMKNPCKVLAGTAAPDPYTGVQVRFVSGGADEIDVDHVVALADAWQKGAAAWPEGKKLAFANDPVNLLAVDAGANRSKGDGDAATWLPPNKAYRCQYVARQVTVKRKYGLWVTAAEQEAMRAVLSACATLVLPPPGSAPTTAHPPTNRATSPAPTTQPPPAVKTPKPAGKPAPKPSTKPTLPPKPPAKPRPGVVHPGSFCSPVGGRGVTVKGTPMVCSIKAGDSRARWRSG